MYLKNLTLKGFKSFADTTSIDLEPGVTVIVGPNGSGKSNVVDAIAWVLGSQAPNALRSSKMDDVIFAGTSEKLALGRAEVSLTIDNHSGTLPIDFNEVRISRTLFRSGDSEYAINGVPCRLIDIAELLSDGGVGRQQHVIVSQGQIDAVLTSRPTDRRAIIEEAAGVLKYRKRKERAERRLATSDSDLTRVKDIIREVRRQLRPLEKQAEAARLHGDLVEELAAQRLHLAGRQIAELRGQLQAIGEQPIHALEQSAKTRLADLDQDIAAYESELSDRSEDDLGDTLRRLESMRERARGLAALAGERRRGIDRDRSAFTDRGVIANLEAEATRLRLALVEAETEATTLRSDSVTLEANEQQLASDRAALDEQAAQAESESGNKAAEARGELAALRAGIETGSEERKRSQTRLDSLAERQSALDSRLSRQRTELETVQTEHQQLVADLDAAKAAQQGAEATLNTEIAAHTEADATQQRWLARAEALTLALHETRSAAGADRVAHVKGVLGTLLDLVVIDEGFEAAFESAVGSGLNAIIVRDPDAARDAFEALRASGSSGAVLALGTLPKRGSDRASGEGSRLFNRTSSDSADPKNPLRGRVQGTKKGVDALLDVLIGDVEIVDGDWQTAVDRALQDPMRSFVTSTGEFIGPDGWRVTSSGSTATAAALTEASEQVVVAGVDCKRSSDRVAAARLALAECVDAAANLSERFAQVESKLEAAVNECRQLETESRDCATESEAMRTGLDELVARLSGEQERFDELESSHLVLEAQESEQREEALRIAVARAQIDQRAQEVAALRTDVEVRAAAINERENGLRTRIAEIEARLERDVSERSTAGRQRELLDRRATVLDKLTVALDSRSATIESQLSEARTAHEQQSETARQIVRQLTDLRSERVALNQQFENLRERAATAAIERAELSTKLQTVVESVLAEHKVAPDVAVSAPCPPLPEGIDPPRRIEQLQNELEIMGPINPLALEECQALQERHEFLQAQLADIAATRRELTKVIASIDDDIVTIFANAFADVSLNFEKLFETLFPGGSGSIRLSTPDDMLNTGIDVSAKPGGKNVRKLSLLSGGERTLTALAFLFAVFMSRPSPFYVLDEVEVALDDVNLHRFLNLVDEFRADAQLVLVSHQKRTMEIADCLYGVSMKPGGSSTVVSEKTATATTIDAA
ncbi:MAG: chromosome segregation protein SMC [Acidimicrobiaceae bacterium]|nr:chromosome segregation protein SMC [Acidimicrobiaceae bacterium]MYD07093.1 chromosome segregation protein SMC [Acidimicrobiaceae bacterium]MYI59076.1 chromosome segregation protein SMC [Acidimicrobiaceae bacterium]